MAFLFGLAGLMFGNPLLIFVGIFVYLAATAETQAIGLQDAARSVTIREAMITSFETLGPDSTLQDAGDALLRTTQHEFPVIDGASRLRGVLTRSALVQGLAQGGPATPVLQVMTGDIPQLRDVGSLTEALEALQKSGSPAVAIVDGEKRLIGYVTFENISELMMLRSAAMAH
jgi:stage IV sporulation protein FB